MIKDHGDLMLKVMQLVNVEKDIIRKQLKNKQNNQLAMLQQLILPKLWPPSESRLRKVSATLGQHFQKWQVTDAPISGQKSKTILSFL